MANKVSILCMQLSTQQYESHEGLLQQEREALPNEARAATTTTTTARRRQPVRSVNLPAPPPTAGRQTRTTIVLGTPEQSEEGEEAGEQGEEGTGTFCCSLCHRDLPPTSYDTGPNGALRLCCRSCLVCTIRKCNPPEGPRGLTWRCY